MKHHILSLIFIVIFYTSGAHTEEAYIELGEAELRGDFSELLKGRGIDYRIDENGRFFYDIMDTSVFTGAYKDLHMADIPTGRSINYPDESVHAEFIKELDKTNVPYVVKKRKGILWVVWEDGYNEQVSVAHYKAKLQMDELAKEFMSNYSAKNSNQKMQSMPDGTN